MPNIKLMEHALPVAPLKIAALDSCMDLGKKVNDHIVEFRQNTLKESLDSPLFNTYKSDNYLLNCSCPRFGTGEAKGLIKESVRGSDLFVMVDVCNHSLTYTVKVNDGEWAQVEDGYYTFTPDKAGEYTIAFVAKSTQAL